MNVAVVRRATAGLAAWLARSRRARHGRGRAGRPTRLGGVRRQPPPRCWPAPGSRCGCCPGPLPTPVLAFAVRRARRRGRRADHRVAQPARRQRLQGLPRRRRPARAAVRRRDRGGDRRARPRPSRSRRPPPPPSVDVTDAYLDRVARLPRGTARSLRIALTPMHGVGGATAVHALHRAGFTDVHVVAEQAAPDPDFPTVAFPNPEEPGATDVLLALAAEVGADLAIALDPDADRCALAVPTAGGWRMLTGDETGVLLGDHLLRTGGVPRSARRDHRRLVVDAAGRRGGVRRALRRDAHRVQVDRPRRTRAWSTATRRRWATASTRTPCATRTASPRPCWPATSPPR